MFIPNKTLNMIKIAGIIVLAALITIIVGQAVLYIKLKNETHTQLTTVEMQLDSLSLTSSDFDIFSSKKHKIVDSQITDAVTSISILEANIAELQSSVTELKNSADMLIVNECKVMPYYMDKSLLTTCRNKGF